jgi:hypothetical protein
MNLESFVERIDDLLWTGAIEGYALIRLYRCLKAYQQGLISAAAVQEAIDQVDPDWYEQLPSPSEP